MITRTRLTTASPEQTALKAGVFAAQGSLFDNVQVGASMTFERNVEIYGEGESADYVYKVLSGSVRAYKVLSDGRRQVTAFYLPGDVFGLELRDGACKFRRGDRQGDHPGRPAQQRVQHRRKQQRDRAAALGDYGGGAQALPESRAAADQDRKGADRGISSGYVGAPGRKGSRKGFVELPMSRQDIADYLGLTIETVSRTLTLLVGGIDHSVPGVTTNRAAQSFAAQ